MDAVVKRMVFCAVLAGVAAGVTNFGLDLAADKVREYSIERDKQAQYQRYLKEKYGN